MNQPKPKSYVTPVTNYMPVIRNGRILFRFDPIRGVIEIQTRGEMETVDLAAEVAQHAQRCTSEQELSNA